MLVVRRTVVKPSRESDDLLCSALKSNVCITSCCFFRTLLLIQYIPHIELRFQRRNLDAADLRAILLDLKYPDFGQV
jgi:hypothetical protein